MKKILLSITLCHTLFSMQIPKQTISVMPLALRNLSLVAKRTSCSGVQAQVAAQQMQIMALQFQLQNQKQENERQAHIANLRRIVDKVAILKQVNHKLDLEAHRSALDEIVSNTKNLINVRLKGSIESYKLPIAYSLAYVAVGAAISTMPFWGAGYDGSLFANSFVLGGGLVSAFMSYSAYNEITKRRALKYLSSSINDRLKNIKIDTLGYDLTDVPDNIYHDVFIAINEARFSPAVHKLSDSLAKKTREHFMADLAAITCKKPTINVGGTML